MRGGICHAIYQYVKANKKYMKYYDKNKALLYLEYWDVNNFTISEKLLLGNFKLGFYEIFIKIS